MTNDRRLTGKTKYVAIGYYFILRNCEGGCFTVNASGIDHVSVYFLRQKNGVLIGKTDPGGYNGVSYSKNYQHGR